MEQDLIGKNAGVIWHILDGKKSVELTHLKKRGFRSPDLADACIICYSLPPPRLEYGGVY